MSLKNIVLILTACALIAGCASTSFIRTPEQAVSFKFDGRDWRMAYTAGNSSLIIAEFGLPGEAVVDWAWTELVTSEVSFVGVDVFQLVKVWKTEFSTKCPGTEIKEINATSAAVTIEYTFGSCGDHPGQKSIKKFFSGKDAIYTLSYDARSGAYTEEKMNRWREIIDDAYLVINPVLEI